MTCSARNIFRCSQRPRWTSLLLAVGTVLLAGFLDIGEATNVYCESVGFMPRTLVITGAKDMPSTPSEKDDDEYIELVDVHTFNHFYTFQVDRDPN